MIGRFGWQARQPTVASQTAAAFAREMGLTNPLVDHDDCGAWNVACRAAPAGGTPEVEPELFNALLAFEHWQSVPIVRNVDESAAGARLFESNGCSQCHRPSLRVDLPAAEAGPVEHAVAHGVAHGVARGVARAVARALIHPYTDLLLHQMGQGLADRDLQEKTFAPSLWRTAPLWGMHAAYVSGQPLRLLHDGRARSIEEAILWHDGEARDARNRYAQMPHDQRVALVEWIEAL